MTQHAFAFEPLGGGRFTLRGAVNFATARAVLEQSAALFRDVPVIKVDLSGVTETDSAGLALLIEWVSWARQAQREMRFFEIPKQICAIARISEAEDLLRAGERLTEAKP
jgi:phospholipid transport system transporter-binding protein